LKDVKVRYSYGSDSVAYKTNLNVLLLVPAVSFLAGLTADVAAVSLFCPVEVVSQRLFIQDQQKKLYSGAFGMFVVGSLKWLDTCVYQ
jgi:hypothetical protein